MIWTPLDLLLSIGSSEGALRAERERAGVTLRTMRDGLLGLVDSGAQRHVGSVQFSNAASDFFCLVQVTETTLRSELQRLEGNVEDVLRKLKAEALDPEDAIRLARRIDALVKGTWPREHGQSDQTAP